jgi:hypothetical protein
MGDAVIQRSFGGGELAPALHARADLVKYTTGLRTCRNFIIQRSGGVTNRPGTRYIASCKTAAATVQLLRYVSEIAGESVLIEAGFDYFRFYKAGARVTLTGVVAWSAIVNYVVGDIVVQGGVNYYAKAASLNQAPPNAAFWYAMPTDILELPNPFLGQHFHWHQTGKVLTLTHYDVTPYELVYVSLTTWILRAIVTGPAVAPPNAGLALALGGVGTRRYAYVVTAAAPDTYEESNPTNVVFSAAAAAPTTAAPHVVSWTPIAGVPEYYVYCDPYANGTFGFIGTATGQASFSDTGFTPDFGLTPPIPTARFVVPNDWPHFSSTYQQRRIFAHTHTVPDGVFGSRTGFPSNFGIASPLQDDDAITFRIAGSQNNPVRHLLALRSLIVLTDAGGWIVNGGDARAPLTPNGIVADQEIYVGSADVEPVIVGNAMVYAESRGKIMRDLQFDQQVIGLGGRDLTIYASHLFDAYTIVAIDLQKTPHSVVWVCRSDGALLGLTYIPEEEVFGWHRHDSGASAAFVDVCVVPEGKQDAVYFIVQRTINGAFVRYIERLEPREIVNFALDAFFVDAGLTYNGAAVSSVSGLNHLEGQTVAVLADGAVAFNGDPTASNAAAFKVTAGAIPLPAPASIVHVGLPIRFADIETLDLDVQGSALRDKQKKVVSLALLIDRSSRGFLVGPDAAHLTPHKTKLWEGVPQESSGQVEQTITANFNERGRILIRQPDPLPLTILGVIPSVEVGG